MKQILNKEYETYAEEYKKMLIETITNPGLSIVFNINIGHAAPRCIIPFGVKEEVDVEKQEIRYLNGKEKKL